MKQSNMFTLNGVIYHPITKIIGDAKQKEKTDILVVVLDNEVFDEAMITIMNRFPQATGIIAEPHSGCKMGKRNTKVSIYIEQYGTTVNLHVLTKAEYAANKSTIDAHSYTEKHELTWSGGQK